MQHAPCVTSPTMTVSAPANLLYRQQVLQVKNMFNFARDETGAVSPSALFRPFSSFLLPSATLPSMPNTSTACPTTILRVRVSRDSKRRVLRYVYVDSINVDRLHRPRLPEISISGYKVSYAFESLGDALMLLGWVFSRPLLYVPAHPYTPTCTPTWTPKYESRQLDQD